ncbi:MAG: pantetheine-phosphate adenylyltransferase [Flavobacteriaceae bacterium]|nr:pantetheine-phosphate adenylyltransferase [Flavobacteriaceae bacterium]MCY4216969.1 pantetheine-phosphate adenylyltransferase [Flavobacteriaceae bacterium]MCY4253602.1 pantetheine-phosphate adenylyltransferase [Flavobacteriaceae bacterium]
MHRAVFPGSFDPLTLGHQDIINRALPYFEEIVIAVGTNIDKEYMFSVEKRMSFIKKSYKDCNKVVVKAFQGMTVDFCKSIKASIIIRGLRNPADFEFEKSVAQINRKLSGIDTLFLLTDLSTSFISSSMVRDIILNGGDYTLLVPNVVRVSESNG